MKLTGLYVYLDLSTAPWEAVLGAKIKAQILDCTADINVSGYIIEDKTKLALRQYRQWSKIIRVHSSYYCSTPGNVLLSLRM